MRERWLAAAVVTVIPLAVACEMDPPEPQELTDEDRQAIEGLSDRYTDLVLAEDWDGWADLFHEDAIRMPQDASTVEGRDAIREAVEPDEGVTFTDFSAQPEEVEGAGDRAYSWGTYAFEVTQEVDDDEVEMQEEGRYMIVARRSDDDPGEWQIYREIFNRSHPPELTEDNESGS